MPDNYPPATNDYCSLCPSVETAFTASFLALDNLVCAWISIARVVTVMVGDHSRSRQHPSKLALLPYYLCCPKVGERYWCMSRRKLERHGEIATPWREHGVLDLEWYSRSRRVVDLTSSWSSFAFTQRPLI